MSDLIDDPAPGQNAPEFTVSELSGAIKRTIEGEFAHVRIRGEVGRVSRPRSGHVYMDLKDDKAVLAGVIWKGVATGLRTQPQEGMEVVATGRLTTFAGQSRYQIVIDSIAPAGMGALMAMLEKRKKALEAEGLFAADRKRPLPYLPEVIGVVTSPSGAVIRDILHRLRDRFPRKVLIWPVAVQGEKCAAEVAAAIAGFNALTPGGAIPRPDVLIVARGGGSVEDLWGFNEEIVVRAAAGSAIPLISAVGHETDTTLIDYASDQRAPTPTAAAEMAVPVRADLTAHLAKLDERRIGAMSRRLADSSQRLRDLGRGLPKPAQMLADRVQRLDAISGRLENGLKALVQERKIQISSGLSGQFGPGLLRVGMTRRWDRLQVLQVDAARALQRRAERSRDKLTGQRVSVEPLRLLVSDWQRQLGRISSDLSRAIHRRITDEKRRLDAAEKLRQTMGYQATLRRGYAVVRQDDGALVQTAAVARKAAALEIEFADGRVKTGTAPRRGTSKASPDDQGELF
ncbi:exodeoxyribonuclease VII large subunit [Halovulum sp. GXIMD14793]